MLGNKRGAETIYLKGKAKWANRLFVPDIEYKKWSLSLYPDAVSLETVRDLQAQGVKNVVKKDEDGYHVNLGRPTEKSIRGKVVAFNPPVVTDKDDNAFAGPIGNGSDVTVKMEVYSHGTPGGGKAKAMRLAAVRVDNLVPFEQSKDFTDEEQEQIKGMDKVSPSF